MHRTDLRLYHTRALVSVATLLLLWYPASVGVHAQEAPTLRSGPVPQAPPPAPPIETRTSSLERPGPVPKGPLTLYSIGQPTDEEQLYLEYINRCRANPNAEGVRLANTTDPDVLSAYSSFGVSLSELQFEMSTNPAVPPLAMNAQLTVAARLHSGDMYTNNYQGHNGTDGSTPGTRATNAGYNFSILGENVYSYAYSVFHGHAAFVVDWGPGDPYGMQPGRGHRVNILTAAFREVGVGVVDGVNGSVGPQLVTQDFGTKLSGATPLITGVVYYDFNGNGFYDVGEGIGGVTVNVTGSAYYAATADSGGFAVPVTTNGNYTVTFSAPGLATNQSVVNISSLKNAKKDYVPVYSPPIISGPNPASVNQSNAYSFTAVGAATGYQWQQTQLVPYTTVEGGESGNLNDFTVISSPGYSVLISDLVASGSFAFHLCMPDFAKQYLTLSASVRANTNSQLSFSKRLGWATSDQVARAQISTNNGASWQDVWSQAGSNGPGDSSYATVSVSLSAYAGQIIQVRFVYDFSSGSAYTDTFSDTGLCLDNIAISNADQLVNPVTSNIPSGLSFAFYPTNAGNYLLLVRAQINSRTLSWGPALTIAATAPPSSLQLLAPVLTGSQVQIDFTVSNYRTNTTFQLWKASTVNGTWTNDASASFSTLIPNSKFRATTSTGGATKSFYKVKASY